jgi:hypothetical protein
MDLLVNIYRTHFPGTGAAGALPPKVMIVRILSVEFPDG